VLTLSVILTTFVTSDGRSHWLTGVMLIVTYTLIGVAYLLLPYDTTPDTAAAGP
jgi:Ca2+/H+ antiporter